MKKTYCNMCGREFDIWDMIEGFSVYKEQIGYGSRHDGDKLCLDLCCDCMDRIIDACKIEPVHSL